MTMRNRKAVIVAFMLIACMLMAVGFAALTDNLIIAGEATANTTESQKDWEADIYFLSADVITAQGTGSSGIADEASVGTSNNDHANYKVQSLAKKDEVAVFVFTIQNDNPEYDAIISIDTGYPTNTNEEYYKVTYVYGDGDGDADDMIVPASGTLEVKATVELLKSPDKNLSAQFTLNLTASSAAPTP